MEFKFQYDEKYPVWVNGIYGNYSFEAKMFDNPSEYGIAAGRISKLYIYDGPQKLVEYDRGWYSGSDLYSLHVPLVNELEDLPPIPDEVLEYAKRINPHFGGGLI
jgi:hypothetical protein